MLGQDDGAYLVADGLEDELLVLGQEKEPRHEDDVGVEGEVAEDGLGLVGEPGLPLDGLSEGLVVDLAELVAIGEGPEELGRRRCRAPWPGYRS